MKLRFLRYERIEAKHPDCFYDIVDREIDEEFPYYDMVPVSSWPVVRVWPDKVTAETGDESTCIEMYWLREE